MIISWEQILFRATDSPLSLFARSVRDPLSEPAEGGRRSFSPLFLLILSIGKTLSAPLKMTLSCCWFFLLSFLSLSLSRPVLGANSKLDQSGTSSNQSSLFPSSADRSKMTLGSREWAPSCNNFLAEHPTFPLNLFLTLYKYITGTSIHFSVPKSFCSFGFFSSE